MTAKNTPFFHPMTAAPPHRGHDLHRVFGPPHSCLSTPMVGVLIILPNGSCLPRTKMIVLMDPTDLKGQCQLHPGEYLILHPWNNRLMLSSCVPTRTATTARVHLTSIICLLPERRTSFPSPVLKKMKKKDEAIENSLMLFSPKKMVVIAIKEE